MSNSELRNLVKPLGPFKKIRQLIPSLADTSTSLGPSASQSKGEQILNAESKKSLSLVSHLKQTKASAFVQKTVSSLFGKTNAISTSTKSKRMFEPSAELVVSDEKRKKKSSNPKPLSVTVVVL